LELGALHKYPNRNLTVAGSLLCSTPSFPLLLFVTLSLAPISRLHPDTLLLLTWYKSFGLHQHLTWRPTWPADRPAHLASTWQAAGSQAAQSAPGHQL